MGRSWRQPREFTEGSSRVRESTWNEEKTMCTQRAVLTARDVMTREPVCVGPEARLRELARVFETNEISGAPVVDLSGRLLGVVSKSDLIRRCSEATDRIPPAYLFEVLSGHGSCDGAMSNGVIPEPLVCVMDIMTASAVTATPETSAAEVARLMFTKNVHRVIIVDEEEFPIGIITSLDLLGAFPPVPGGGCARHGAKSSPNARAEGTTGARQSNAQTCCGEERSGEGCGCKRPNRTTQGG